MMVIILKIVGLWLLMDVVIVATGWYLVAAIRPTFPHWWRWVMAEESPGREKPSSAENAVGLH